MLGSNPSAAVGELKHVVRCMVSVSDHAFVPNAINPLKSGLIPLNYSFYNLNAKFYCSLGGFFHFSIKRLVFFLFDP